MANTITTRRAIQDAFLALLEERTLNRITVRDITDRCGINRNTFDRAIATTINTIAAANISNVLIVVISAKVRHKIQSIKI